MTEEAISHDEDFDGAEAAEGFGEDVEEFGSDAEAAAEVELPDDAPMELLMELREEAEQQVANGDESAKQIIELIDARMATQHSANLKACGIVELVPGVDEYIALYNRGTAAGAPKDWLEPMVNEEVKLNFIDGKLATCLGWTPASYKVCAAYVAELEKKQAATLGVSVPSVSTETSESIAPPSEKPKRKRAAKKENATICFAAVGDWLLNPLTAKLAAVTQTDDKGNVYYDGEFKGCTSSPEWVSEGQEVTLSVVAPIQMYERIKQAHLERGADINEIARTYRAVLDAHGIETLTLDAFRELEAALFELGTAPPAEDFGGDVEDFEAAPPVVSPLAEAPGDNVPKLAKDFPLAQLHKLYEFEHNLKTYTYMSSGHCAISGPDPEDDCTTFFLEENSELSPLMQAMAHASRVRLGIKPGFKVDTWKKLDWYHSKVVNIENEIETVKTAMQRYLSMLQNDLKGLEKLKEGALAFAETQLKGKEKTLQMTHGTIAFTDYKDSCVLDDEEGADELRKVHLSELYKDEEKRAEYAIIEEVVTTYKQDSKKIAAEELDNYKKWLAQLEAAREEAAGEEGEIEIPQYEPKHLGWKIKEAYRAGYIRSPKGRKD